MNYTKNYRLPQWVKSDRIMMEDFNAAMASMENGMTSAAATADAAAAKADAAKQSADTAYTPSNKPYVVGTYVGNGETTAQTINLGFKPSFVIITHQGTASPGGLAPALRFGILSRTNGGFGDITSTGFQVRVVTNQYPELNMSGATYGYIAFR